MLTHAGTVPGRPEHGIISERHHHHAEDDGVMHEFERPRAAEHDERCEDERAHPCRGELWRLTSDAWSVGTGAVGGGARWLTCHAAATNSSTTRPPPNSPKVRSIDWNRTDQPSAPRTTAPSTITSRSFQPVSRCSMIPTAASSAAQVIRFTRLAPASVAVPRRSPSFDRTTVNTPSLVTVATRWHISM